MHCVSLVEMNKISNRIKEILYSCFNRVRFYAAFIKPLELCAFFLVLFSIQLFLLKSFMLKG